MITIGAPLEHTLDEPIGLLSDCHRRIERFLDSMIRVTEVTGTDELSPKARVALDKSLEYFRSGGPMHTEDEEESLFPRMRKIAEGTDSDAEKARKAMDIVDRLHSDHKIADERHAAIDVIGQRWLKEGSLPADELEKLQEELRSLRAFYAEHIEVEDNELFPTSAEVLSEEEVKAMGKEMAARRNIGHSH